MNTSIQFSPFDPAIIADPFPAYAELRRDAPVHYSPDDDLWVVSRYDDVLRILRDPDRFSSARGMGLLASGRARAGVRSPFEDLGRLRILIATDPPEHTQLRRLVSRAFTPRVIAALEQQVRRVCGAMVDDLIDAGAEADLVLHLAYPFPVIVIAELLGIPAERRSDFKRWSDGVVGTLSGTLDASKAATVGAELFSFFRDIVAERSQTAGDDLISQLVVNGRDGDAALSADEIVMFCILLLIAGNETTTNLIGSTMHALWDRPDQLRRIAADPGLVPNAVEEALRFCGPVQGLFRGTTADVIVGDTEIPERSYVLILFASANRDEDVFDDPDRFDATRDATGHLGFGWGIHHCLGAQLARLEARIAGEVLLERLASLEPRSTPERIDSFLLRGYRRIPVAVRAR
jgi:cytochrome P450